LILQLSFRLNPCAKGTADPPVVTTKRRKANNGYGFTSKVQAQPLRDNSNTLTNENLPISPFDGGYTPYQNVHAMVDSVHLDGAEAMFVENSNATPAFSTPGAVEHFYEEGLVKMNLLTFEEPDGTAVHVM
jgi:hypothetical protein